MADDMNLEIVLESVDDSQAGFAQMDEALKAVQQLADELSKSFASFASNVQTAMSQASASVETLSTPIDTEAQKIATAFEEPAKQAQAQLETIAQGLGNISSEATTQAADIAKVFDEPVKTAEETLSGIATTAATVGEQAAQNMKPLDDEINKIKQSILATEDELIKVAEESNIKNSGAIAGGSHGEEGGIFGMQGQMDSMYAGMALGAVAAPVDAGLGASIDQFSQFDQAMRLVNQELGLSQSGFQNLEQSVLSLSNSTGISAQELSSGLYNVVASGVTNTSDALTLLKTAAEGAKAGNTDLNTATEALNAVMGAYGMNASQASNIMDVMFTAVNNGQMHFTDLAKSVGASATSAATAGVSYTELAAAQATLTNVGKNAESASQNLNSLIMGIIAPTSQASKEAKSLGIEWDAQALKAHGLSYMIDEASKATGGNSEELKKLVPNQRAYMAVLALGETAHKQYTDTLNKMKDAHGATAAAMEEYDKGAGDEIEKMKTSVTNAAISLGQALAPAIETVTKAVSDLANWFSNLSPHTKEFLGIALLLVGGLATLGATFLMTISGIGALVTGFKALREAILAATEAETLMEALSPVGWIMLAVAAVVTLAVEIYTHWDQIKAKTKELEDKFVELKNAAIDKIHDAFKTLQAAVSDIEQRFDNLKSQTLGALKNAFSDVTQAINNHKTAITITASILGTIFGPAIIKAGIEAGVAGTKIASQFVVNIVKTGVEAVVAGTKMAVSFVANIVKSGAEAAVAGTKMTAQFIASIVKAGAEAVVTGGRLAVSLIANVITLGMQAYVTAIKITTNLVTSLISFAAEGWKAAASAAAQTAAIVKMGVESAVAGGKMAAEFIVNITKSGVEAAVAGAKMTAQFITAIVKSGAEAVAAGAKFASSLIANIIKLGIESVVTAGKITGQAIVAFVSFAAEGAKTAISIAAQTTALVANGIAVVAQKAALVASTIATSAATAAQWAFNVALDANPIGIIILAVVALGAAIYELCIHFGDIKKAVEDAWNAMITKFGEWLNDAKQWGSNLVKMIGDGINNAVHYVEDAASNVANSIKSFLGFHSPTEKGPASDSDKWAGNFVSMFASGLAAGAPQVASAAQALVQPLANAFGQGQSMTSAMGFSQQNAQEIVQLTNNVIKAKQDWANASVKNDQAAMASAAQIADQNRKALQQMGVDTSGFAADKSLPDSMKAIQTLMQSVTTSMQTKYKTTTTSMQTNNTSLATSTATTTSDMSSSWTATTQQITQTAVTLKTQVESTLSSLAAVMKSASASMQNSMVTAFKTMEEAVSASMAKIRTEITQTQALMVSFTKTTGVPVVSSAPVSGGRSSGAGTLVFSPTINVSGNIAKNEQDLAKMISQELYKQVKTYAKF